MQSAVDEAAEHDQPVVRKERVAPPARKGKRRLSLNVGGLLSRIPVVRGIAAYFSGVFSEVQKVTWPSRDETARLTRIVLIVTVVFSIGLGILDTFYSWWFRQAFHADSEWIFLIIGAVVAVVAGGGYAVLRHRI
jgi:preprotein translocase SecE subunit